ncbi:fungal specific transcription factor domain-containing protein [Seiridium cupressi]
MLFPALSAVGEEFQKPGQEFGVLDRQLRVSQKYVVYTPKDSVISFLTLASYLEELLAENDKLRRLNPGNRSSDGNHSVAEAGRVALDCSENSDGPLRNPLFGDRPWFHDTPGAPILIGEAADAAFATRFCQTLSDGSVKHIQRISFPTDNTLLTLGAAACPLPTRGKARFLLKAAIGIVSQYYHIVLRSVVLGHLERFLHQPSGFDILLGSKMWALLALGELYTARSGDMDNFPGLAYFAQANRALQMIQERPSLDSIEVLLLLSLYNLSCNRRHSAFCLAGSAVRQGIIMGLHLNVPDSQLGDPVMREHRNRVWWTAYEFDRLLAARLSQPFSIQDDEIELDLPSDSALPRDSKDDFTGAHDLVNRIKLVRLTGQITKLLYGRKAQKDSFLQRVQQALKDLQDWFRTLEGGLNVEEQRASKNYSGAMRSLLLSFNQCMIVATRPVALYMLRAHRGRWSADPAQTDVVIPDNVQALTEACIQCARHSHSILLDSWIAGSFLTFDYFDTLYIFSVATIFAVSSLLNGPGSSKDHDDFELSLQLLTELKGNGNCAAVEFCRHLESMKTCMSRIDQSTQESQRGNVNGLDMAVHGLGDIGMGYPSGNTPYNMTAGMALAEPSMQAFLAQTDPNFQQMDLSLLQHELDGFYWPES